MQPEFHSSGTEHYRDVLPLCFLMMQESNGNETGPYNMYSSYREGVESLVVGVEENLGKEE